MTSLGNTTAGGNATGNTTLSQTIVGVDNSTNTEGNTTTAGGNTTATAAQAGLPYILSGDWNLDVKDGTVSDFKANFTMVHTDGTGGHTHDIANFQSSNGSTITLNQTGTMFIFGTADISANGQQKWSGVDALITIDNNNAFSISFASQDSDDHFKGQPIYGVVHSLKDQSGTEMVQAGGTSTAGNATGGNMTGNTTTSGNMTGSATQSALNQTGNATGGAQDFLNGTG